MRRVTTAILRFCQKLLLIYAWSSGIAIGAFLPLIVIRMIFGEEPSAMDKYLIEGCWAFFLLLSAHKLDRSQKPRRDLVSEKAEVN